MSGEKWQLQPVCKTCRYRWQIDKGTYSEASRMKHTACHYLLDTGEMRDGKPQGDYCLNHKPKVKRGVK